MSLLVHTTLSHTDRSCGIPALGACQLSAGLPYRTPHVVYSYLDCHTVPSRSYACLDLPSSTHISICLYLCLSLSTPVSVYVCLNTWREGAPCCSAPCTQPGVIMSHSLVLSCPTAWCYHVPRPLCRALGGFLVPCRLASDAMCFRDEI